MNSVNYQQPKTEIEKWCDWLVWALLLLMGMMTASHYRDLPERIPTHFDISGAVDGWGSKKTIWLLPSASVFLVGLLSLANRFPQMFNYPVKITPENAQRQYILARQFLAVLKVSLLVVFTTLQMKLVAMAKNVSSLFDNTWVFIIFVSLASFVPIVIYLIFAYRQR